MGGIGYAIGQVLQGAGEGLAAQADANQKTALEDMQTRRELALEQLKEQADQQNTAAEHTNRLDEIQAQGEVNDTLDAHRQARGFSYDTQTQAQKTADQIKTITLGKGLDLQNDQVLENLRHKNRLSEDQAHDMRELAFRAQQDNTLIDHFEVDKNGHMVGFTKTGRAYQSMTNQYPYSGESDNGDQGGSIADVLARNGGGRNAIPPRASTTGPGAAPDTSALAQLRSLPPPPDGRVGATATGPNGLKATWNGKQWVLNDVNGG